MRYEVACSLISGIEHIHRAGRLVGSFRPEEMAVEDGTHNIIFLRLEGLLRTDELCGRLLERRNTMMENPCVLPLLRSLLFPGADADDAVDLVGQYLTDELRVLLFPKYCAPELPLGSVDGIRHNVQLSKEQLPMPISLQLLLSACLRAMQRLQFCPSCEAWYFSEIGKTNLCPSCAWVGEEPAGARFGMRVVPKEPYSIGAKAEDDIIDFPVQEWIFRKGKQKIDIRLFLPQPLADVDALPLITIDFLEDGSIWVANETEVPLKHCNRNDMIISTLPKDRFVQMERRMSRIVFPDQPLMLAGEEIACTKIWMEIE